MLKVRTTFETGESSTIILEYDVYSSIIKKESLFLNLKLWRFLYLQCFYSTYLKLNEKIRKGVVKLKDIGTKDLKILNASLVILTHIFRCINAGYTKKKLVQLLKS